MSITFACGQCGKSFTVDDQLAGKTGRCKQCGATMTIPSPAAPPAALLPGDVFGLEEPSLPPRAAQAPAPPRAIADDPLAPPRAKPKKGGVLGAVGTVAKVVLAIFGGLIAFGAVVGGISAIFPGVRAITTPGFKTRAGLEAILQKRVALNQELAAMLGTVQDVDGAKATSPKAVGKIREITLNLREMKTAKALQTDLDALKVQYTPPQEAAARQVLTQVMRVAQIPGAWDALAVQGAFEELEREERSIPGLKQVEMPPPPASPPVATAPSGDDDAPAPKTGPGTRPRPAAGLMSRANIESLFKRRVSLHDDVTKIMSEVQDPKQAKSRSARAVMKVRQITANLKQIKAARALKVDIEAVGAQYAPLQEAAAQRLLAEASRLHGIPGAWEALGAQAAFEDLGHEEEGIADAKQADSPEGGAPAQPDDANPAPAPAPTPGQQKAPAGTRPRRGRTGPPDGPGQR